MRAILVLLVMLMSVEAMADGLQLQRQPGLEPLVCFAEQYDRIARDAKKQAENAADLVAEKEATIAALERENAALRARKLDTLLIVLCGLTLVVLGVFVWLGRQLSEARPFRRIMLAGDR